MSTGQMQQQSSKRFNYIDFLKFLGLTGIITAHVGCPDAVKMLRSWDVPLMVIVSAFLGGGSYDRFLGKGGNGVGYAVKRFKRLVIPTWILLLIYFLGRFASSGTPEATSKYLYSFGLTRYGIGYVWIILIYLYSALLIPVFKRIPFNRRSVCAVLVIYAVYEFCCHHAVGMSSRLIETTFYYIVPYGALTFLGYHYGRMDGKGRKLIIGTSLIIFLVMMVYYRLRTGAFQLVQIAKYPPRLYYLSYGIFCSFAMMEICGRKKLLIYECPPVRYISKHSLWIYLWHIIVLDLYVIIGLPEVWYIKLVVVYSASVFTVWLVNRILDLLERKRGSIGILEYFRG